MRNFCFHTSGRKIYFTKSNGVRCTANTLNIMTMHFALNNQHESHILFAPYYDHPCSIGLCRVSRYLVNGATFGAGRCKGTENFQVKEFDITENGQWHSFRFSINSQPLV